MSELEGFEITMANDLFNGRLQSETVPLATSLRFQRHMAGVRSEWTPPSLIKWIDICCDKAPGRGSDHQE